MRTLEFTVFVGLIFWFFSWAAGFSMRFRSRDLSLHVFIEFFQKETSIVLVPSSDASYLYTQARIFTPIYSPICKLLYLSSPFPRYLKLFKKFLVSRWSTASQNYNQNIFILICNAVNNAALHRKNLSYFVMVSPSIKHN